MPMEVEHKGAVGSWTRDELEDQYLRLYDDYLTLKKHGCKQEERIKKMATKLLRLANDKKSGAANAVWEDDYREQIEALERKNAALSQKLLLAQNQLNVQRQRVGSAPSTGRPVNRTNMRTLVGTPRDGRGKEAAATGALQTARMQNAALEQTIKKLSEHLQEREKTIGQLKEELLTKDANHQQDMQALMQQLTTKQRDKLKENIDLIRNQRELREKQLQISTLEARLHDMESDQQITKEANRKLVAEVERLTSEIGLLEQKNIRLESASNSTTKDHLKLLELQNAYDDVKRENQFLKESNEKLMVNAFSGMSEQTWLRQEQTLRAQISHLEALLQKQSSYRASPSSDAEQIIQARASGTEASAPTMKPGNRSFVAPQTISSSTAVNIAQAAGFSQDELEEALMLLRERKLRQSNGNEDLGFLEKVNSSETQDVAKRLKECESAHAETIAELEKTRKLLSVQYKINKDYRAEASDVSQRLAAVKSESEQRLAEYAKLLDIRAARIRHLEMRLEEKAYGTKQRKVGDNDLCSEQMIASDQMALSASAPKRSENLIEIHMGQLNMSVNAANQLLAVIRPDQSDADSKLRDLSSLRLFLTWDFYDFETQATPFVSGLSADFNLTVQYPVEMDDYMLGYLHRGQCTVELHQSFDGRYRTVATGQLNMASLLETSDVVGSLRNADETVSRCHGQLELYGSTSGPTEFVESVIGKLDYWIRLSVPMPQALRIYRERFRGLPRLPPTVKRPRSQAATTATAEQPDLTKEVVTKNPNTFPGEDIRDPLRNQLHIYVTQVTDLRARQSDCVPSPYFVYQFYDQPEVVSVIMDACSNAKFDSLQSFPVQLSEKLDQYLRTQNLVIYVMDNADPEDSASCLGAAIIPLLGLVTRPTGRIEGVFALHPLSDVEPQQHGRITASSVDGQTANGLVHVKIYWHTPYAFSQHVSPVQPELQSTREHATVETVNTVQCSENRTESTVHQNRQIELPVLSLKKSRDPDGSRMKQTSGSLVHETNHGSETMNLTVPNERALSSPDPTSSEDPGFPKPLPRSKLGKSRSPVPNRSQPRTLPEPLHDVNGTRRTDRTESNRSTPIPKVDENHVQISLHRIQLTQKPISWVDWSKTRRLFVEYRFLGHAEPFETGSSALVEKDDVKGSGRLHVAELNYTKAFEVDFKDNYERRQHLASFLLADDSKHGQVNFVVVAEPTGETSQSSECEEIGVARVNIRQILLNGLEPMEKLIPIYPMNGKEDGENERGALGHLCVSISCLAALRSIMSELP